MEEFIEMMKKMFGKKRKGMTLVELILVVVIVGILAAGGYMILGNNSDKAKYARAQDEINVIASAANLVVAESGADAVCGAAGAAFVEGSLDGKLSKELTNMNDPWGNPYQVTTTANSYILKIAPGTGSPTTNPFSNPANESLERSLNFSNVTN